MTTEKDHFTLNLTKRKTKKMTYQEKLENAGFEIKYYSTKIIGVLDGLEYFITYKNKLSRDYEPEFKSSYTKEKQIGLI